MLFCHRCVGGAEKTQEEEEETHAHTKKHLIQSFSQRLSLGMSSLIFVWMVLTIHHMIYDIP